MSLYKLFCKTIILNEIRYPPQKILPITNNLGMNVRRAKQGDIERICELYMTAFPEDMEYLFGEPFTDIATKFLIHNFTADKNLIANCLVAEKNGKVLGVCSTRFSDYVHYKETEDFDTDSLSLKSITRMICSFGMLDYLSRVNEGECLIDFMAVDPEFRNNGIGQMLMHSATMNAIDKGCKQLCLLVSPYSIRARKLYEKLDFILERMYKTLPIFLLGDRTMFIMVKYLPPTYSSDEKQHERNDNISLQ
ncbi:DgyrCDS9665 [Dimorphilus gyrociliatus]|uniref:DgyrCDS9665 n=1 Tax=Dimorphilus gyrociliatus TaxID=2664684 RepID=A0A7I8VY15_9ANNE|nr:DgyrCDS9665 [Dimorphilus gyrociliatus]